MRHAYRFGSVEVVPVRRELWVDGRVAPVGARAFDVLVALIERRGRLATKAELLDAAWPGLVVEENNLQAQVSALRKLVGAASIKTVSGLGYRFAAPLAGEDGADNRVVLPSDPAEQSRIDRLAVFAGSFRLEAAAQVAWDDGASRDAAEVARRLERHGLVCVDGTLPRYRVPEGQRQAARDRLSASGEMEAAIRLHGLAMARIGDEAFKAFWTTRNEAEWVAAYRGDYDDLDIAFRHACERRDATVAGLIANALARLELERDATFARRRKEEAYRLLRDADESARANLLGYLTSFRSIEIPQMSFLQAAIEREAIWRRKQQQPQHYRALVRLVNAYASHGRFAAMESALRSARAMVDPRWPARVRWNGSFNESQARLIQGHAEGSRTAAEAMLRIADETPDPSMKALSRSALGYATALAGDLPSAIEILEANQAALRDCGLWRPLGCAIAMVSAAYMRLEQPRRACEAAKRALPIVLATDACWLLDPLAQLCAQSGRNHEASLLLGYGDERHEAKPRPGPQLFAHAAWEAAATARRALGPREHARLRRMGAALSRDQIASLAEAAIAAALRPE